MKIVAMLIALLALMFLVSKQMSTVPGGPSVKVPQVELPQATQDAMRSAASGAANQAQATVQALGAAATQVLQSGADQTAEKLKAAEAAAQK